MIQVEETEHIHQKWGPIYNNADLWLQKVWSGYIPPEYNKEKIK